MIITSNLNIINYTYTNQNIHIYTFIHNYDTRSHLCLIIARQERVATFCLGVCGTAAEVGADMDIVSLRNLLEDVIRTRSQADARYIYISVARVVAQGMRAYGIDVTASKDIGGDVPVCRQKAFEHKRCVTTGRGDEQGIEYTVIEDVDDCCGKGAIVLTYKYPTEPFPPCQGGQVRIVDQNGVHYTKYYGLAARSDFALILSCRICLS